MPISVTCRNCDESYTVRDENAGRTFKCKSCGESVTVPAKRGGGGSRGGGTSRGGGSRSESGTRSAPPARRKKPTRKRARPPEDDYEDYDAYDDDGNDDSYDEGPSRGGGRRGRSSGRSSKRPSRSSGKKKLTTGLLVVAISGCVYAAGFAALVFAKLVILFASRMGSFDSVSTLMTGHVWLQFLGAAGMLVGYIVCVMGPDKGGSRNLNIAALVMGVIAVGLVFFLQILPRFETGGATGMRQLSRLVGFGLLGTGGLWESIFKQLLLEAILLSHLVLFTLTVRAHSSRNLESSCTFALFPIAGYGGLKVIHSLYLVLLFKVILPGAVENREPPSAFWNWVNNGLDWLGTAAMVVFLVLYLRVLFLSRSDV